jgi:hypothetical protein
MVKNHKTAGVLKRRWDWVERASHCPEPVGLRVARRNLPGKNGEKKIG